MTNSQKELLDRRSELTRQLVDLVREMSEVEERLKSIAKNAQTAARDENVFDRRSPSIVIEAIKKLAAKVLEDGTPKPTSLILEYMELYEPNFKMPGKDRVSNLSKHLSNSSRFKSTKKGWILAPKGGQS